MREIRQLAEKKEKLKNKFNMCLTIPKQVVVIKKDYIELSRTGFKKLEKVGTILKVKKGDWVLTQNNIIVSKISKQQAKEINKLLK